LTQLRTGKIGFNNFLYSRGVPEVLSRRCACDIGDMTARHIIRVCPNWGDTAKRLYGRNRARFKGNPKQPSNGDGGDFHDPRDRHAGAIQGSRCPSGRGIRRQENKMAQSTSPN
jgi:hypothetical protein